jgi:acetylornithine deacetylase/succinyl-diaminopimelate desuccinylase-like protein
MERWFSKNLSLILDDLFSFLRFKSISADPAYQMDILECAKWLSNYLFKIGLHSELLSTVSYPIVFARNKKIKKDKPTILIYGHYDVQPVDPLSEWIIPPFEPRMIDGNIYGRGALDDKGQMFYTILALQFLLEKWSDLSFNLKFCIEGEEESSSKGLFESLDKYKEILQADYLFAIDFGMLTEDVPAITLGARGMVTLSIEFVGSNRDFHSGEFGGVAYNPLRSCVETLSKLWDKNGKVAIPGFYDEVVDISPNSIKLSFEREKYEKEFALKAFYKEEGFSQLESNWLRPTIEINGIGGGYFETGFKSVIPKKVVCKLSARLVKDQDPQKIALLIKDFLQKQTKKGIDLKVEISEGGRAFRGSMEGKLTKVLSQGMEEIFKKPPQYIYSGGSVPVVASLIEKLKVEPTMMGVGIPTDNIHAPNEHFSLERLKKGFLTVVKTLELFGG